MDVVYFQIGMDTVLWTWFTFRWGWTQFYGRGLLSVGDSHYACNRRKYLNDPLRIPGILIN